MSEIGGYFGLEVQEGNNYFHDSPYKLKSGRSALTLLLNHLKPSLVYLPFYTCNALLEPFWRANIRYQLYNIDEQLEIMNMSDLQPGELLLYINYFGIRDQYVEQLSQQYGDKLIVDCTQSYFTKGNDRSWFFNSARKFFGVPDGSDLYVPGKYDLINEYNNLPINENYLTDHLLARFNGHTQEGYSYFQQNEILNGGEPAGMSQISRTLLSNINYESVIRIRKNNFNFLHSQLQDTNRLKFTYSSSSTAFCYPYLPQQTIEKKKLWGDNIFVPVLWNDCLQRENISKFPVEKDLSENLINIPVDHRYSIKQMDIILEQIQKIHQNEI